MPFFVYVLQSEVDGTYYKGFTENYRQRFADHNAGLSRYTSKKVPWVLVFVQQFSSKREALQREKQLKRANADYLQWVFKQSYNLMC